MIKFKTQTYYRDSLPKLVQGSEEEVDKSVTFLFCVL